MLTYISSHPTAAVEIAAPSGRNDVVIFGWSFCFGWVVIVNPRAILESPLRVLFDTRKSPSVWTGIFWIGWRHHINS